jgi:hypothetical protein
MVRQVSAAFGIAVLASLLRSETGDRARAAASAPADLQAAYNHVFLWMTLLGVATLLVAPFLPRRQSAAVPVSEVAATTGAGPGVSPGSVPA